MKNVEPINVEKELDRFFTNLIKQSRANLTRTNSNASKRLYNEMTYRVNVGENSIDADFLLPKQAGHKAGQPTYGELINYGVGGAESSYIGLGLANKGRRISRYTNKRPPVKAIKKWMRVKPVKARSKETGRFITQEQGAYMIANAIYKRGIKPTEFFSRPFEREFKRLPDELIEAYGIDVEDFMDFVLNDK